MNSWILHPPTQPELQPYKKNELIMVEYGKNKINKKRCIYRVMTIPIYMDV